MGPGRCCCRLSEVHDWEDGGRTKPEHLERIFTKERASGERRVLVVMREVRNRRRAWAVGGGRLLAVAAAAVCGV